MFKSKNEVIRNVLRSYSRFNPAFRIDGKQLVFNNRGEALRSLQYHSLDLLAFSVCEVDSDTRGILKKSRIEESVFQVRLLNELSQVFAILSEEKIFAVVIKGFSLKRYYPPDCLRPFSDIDFIIHPKDKYNCLAAFKRAGYRLINEKNLERLLALHGELSWVNPATNISVEFHWDLVNAKSMRKITNFDPDFIFSRLERLRVENIELNVLPRSIDLAYLMAHHVLHHQFKRLLWFVDVLLLLTTEDIDWNEFEEAVGILRMERPVHYYLNAVLSIFGRDSLRHLEILEERFRPGSRRYFFFSSFNPPERIFKKGQAAAKLRDRFFRSAFK